MEVEIVVGSFHHPRDFPPGTRSYFLDLLSSRTNISKIQFDPDFQRHRFVSRETFR